MALIFGGNAVETTAHVIDWRSHGMQFVPKKHKGVGTRKVAPRLCILHYTASENPPPVVFKNLQKRNCAVEFCMDAYGTIYQFADPFTTFCAHCKGQNVRSFGLEIQNRGTAARGTIPEATWVRWEKEIPRGTYRDKICGNDVAYASFTKDQMDALVEFLTSLVEAGVIPNIIPSNWCERLPPAKRKTFVGVAGHYHFDTDKKDPGSQIFDELPDEGFRPR